MMTRFLTPWLLLLLTGVGLPQTQPPRDAEVQPTYGSGSISGTVVSDGANPRPVRRAVVWLSGAGLRPSRGAITDDTGRFRIDGLPAGSFTLTVVKASYISSVYGAKRPGRPGTAIVVTDGQAIDALIVRLWRGAVVAGVLRDVDGRPVPGVRVTAIADRPDGDGPMTLSNNLSVQTDDRGAYRIFGLAPGTYAVAALPGSSGASATLARSEARIDAILAALASGQPAPTAQVPASAADQARPFTYSPVYYPGTASVSEARPIELDAGQEAAGLDFTLLRVPTAAVRGTIARPDGQPAADAEVQLQRLPAGSAFEVPEERPLEVRTTPEGRFEFAAVPPGAYRLIARASLEPQPPQGAGGFVTPGIRGTALWADNDLVLSGSDIGGLALTLQMPFTVTGTVRFVGDDLTPPDDLSRYRVGLMLPELLDLRRNVTVRSKAFAAPVAIGADGSFSIPNLMPGRYGLTVTGPNLGPDGWWPRSAMADGRDWLDGLVELTRNGPPAGGVAVTLTDRHTTISGVLQTPTGAPATDVFVIAFAADAGYWGVHSRRVLAVRPDVAGRYTIDDLPAGSYRLAAVLDADEQDWEDPAFLQQLLPASIEVAVRAGETTVQDLMLGGG